MAANIKQVSFPALLEKQKGEIAKALPAHISADRCARIALTAFRRNEMLAKCNPLSVFAAVIQSAQLGLEIDSLGQAYLVPYKTRDGNYECQFVPGWKGLVDLVNRAGRATVWTGAVFEGDQFDYALGDSPYIRHQPGDEDDESKLTHVYAVGRVRGAEQAIIEVWSKAKCIKHRDRYNKVGGRHYSHQHFEMYARKIVLLQVLKYLPTSAELSLASALSHAAETGSQGLTIKDAIDGTWSPIVEEPKDEAADLNAALGVNTETGEVAV